MKTKFISLLLGLFLLVTIAAVSADSGAIWTTRNDCGNESQDVNQYNIGDKVYINGENFEAGDYIWTITGAGGSNNSQASCDPDTIVASGSYTPASNGTFCFEAYTVASDDCGEYKAKFNGKGDNYHIIPEFGTVVGVLTLASALVILFFVRRK